MKHFDFFEMILSPGDVVLDVGAHRGYYARKFSSLVGDSGKVFSFEAHPAIYADLKLAAVCSRKNIFPNCIAVSDTEGTTMLNYSDNAEADQAATICQVQANENQPPQDGKQIEVKTISLDTFCKTAGIVPNFVKIDVEGAEDKVIDGMQNLIKQHSPAIMFECGIDGPIPPRFQKLRDLGYEMWLVDMTRFYPPDYSWATTMDSSCKPLRDKIFSFTDKELFEAQHTLTNVFCLHKNTPLSHALQNRVMPFSLALPQIASPVISWKARAFRLMPMKIALAISRVRNRLVG